MYEYNLIYLTTGIRYPFSKDIIPLRERNEYIKRLNIDYYWQLELIERLNSLSADGWELVQMSEDVFTGDSLDGFGIFRRKLDNDSL